MGSEKMAHSFGAIGHSAARRTAGVNRFPQLPPNPKVVLWAVKKWLITLGRSVTQHEPARLIKQLNFWGV